MWTAKATKTEIIIKVGWAFGAVLVNISSFI